MVEGCLRGLRRTCSHAECPPPSPSLPPYKGFPATSHPLVRLRPSQEAQRQQPAAESRTTASHARQQLLPPHLLCCCVPPEAWSPLPPPFRPFCFLPRGGPPQAQRQDRAAEGGRAGGGCRQQQLLPRRLRWRPLQQCEREACLLLFAFVVSSEAVIISRKKKGGKTNKCFLIDGKGKVFSRRQESTERGGEGGFGFGIAKKGGNR